MRWPEWLAEWFSITHCHWANGASCWWRWVMMMISNYAAYLLHHPPYCSRWIVAQWVSCCRSADQRFVGRDLIFLQIDFDRRGTSSRDLGKLDAILKRWWSNWGCPSLALFTGKPQVTFLNWFFVWWDDDGIEQGRCSFGKRFEDFLPLLKRMENVESKKDIRKEMLNMENNSLQFIIVNTSWTPKNLCLWMIILDLIGDITHV